MLARYAEGRLWACKRDGITLISGPSVHVLAVRLSDRLYAYASPEETWSMRRPTVRRKK
jgi:hypothetical protein